MQETIHGITLGAVRYRDTRQIVHLYTLEHGRMALVAPCAGSGKGRKAAQPALWRPLNIVETEADVRAAARLPWVRAPRLTEPWTTLCSDPVKGTLCLFLSELLTAALQEQQSEPPLFQFICDSLRWLDNATYGYANFHLVFMMRLMTFLGIQPDTRGWHEGWAFNLGTGEFQPVPAPLQAPLRLPTAPLRLPPIGGRAQTTEGRAQTIGGREGPQAPHLLPPDEARWMPLLLRMNYTNMRRVRLSRHQRRRCIEVLNRYFSLQLPPFPTLRSVNVLAEVFDA